MELIADILLIGAALAATVYCIVLSRRLRRFTDLEKGVGGAIAMLSGQVDDMTRTLEVAQASAIGSTETLNELTGKAENAARRLELLVAAMHDLPDPESAAGNNRREPPPETAMQPEESEAAEPLFLSKRARLGTAAE